MITTAVIGWPVEHSRSPEMITAAFAAVGIEGEMLRWAIEPGELARRFAAMRTFPITGASVTSPHKLAVHALCDALSPEAQAIGAVNCVHKTNRTLVGHNTDAAGFANGLAAEGFPGGHVVLLGAGGAARAVAYGLGNAVEVVARRAPAWTEATPWSELPAAFARADLVVDCTSMALHTDESHLLPLDQLRPGAWVASLIYHQVPPLLVAAAARGHRVLDGRAMLVHQGARAFEIWTGRPAPVDAMRRALDASLTSAAE